jgi:hypothetical protein
MLALGTLLAGLGTAASVILVAKGRKTEVYAVATAVAIVGAFVGAARVLETGEGHMMSPPRMLP